MSRKSRESPRSRANASKALERPFAAGVLTRAGKIACEYRLILESSEAVGYVGSAVEFPTVFADGPTPDACVEATREALTFAVATMLEANQTPPSPASAGKRDVQVNIRLAAHEKHRLQEAARRFGFKGISDFVRTAALERSRTA